MHMEKKNSSTLLMSIPLSCPLVVTQHAQAVSLFSTSTHLETEPEMPGGAPKPPEVPRPLTLRVPASDHLSDNSSHM